MTSRRKLVLVVAGAIAVPALATAGTRVSGGDATVVAETFAVQPAKVESAFATCPAGQRAVGGGVGQAGATSPSFGALQESGPLGSSGSFANTVTGNVARSWSASVLHDVLQQDGRDYKVFAICSASSDATIVASTTSLAAGQIGVGKSNCPAGRRAVGGGALGPPGQTGVSAWASLPLSGTNPVPAVTGDVPVSWVAAFRNRSEEAREVKVFAICSADSDATVVATRFSVDAGKVGDALATCPAGKRVLGGGAAVVFGFPTDSIQQSNPVDSSGTTAETTSGDIARSWFASVHHSSAGSSSGTFQVVAICASDEQQPAPPTTTTTTAPKPPTKAKVVCAGRQATIVGTSGPDRLRGTPGVDVIAGLGGNDIVNGVGGNDTICGGSGNDTILGAGGNDTLRGDGGDDRLRGGIGNDILAGALGNDTIFGEAGDDILFGGPGDDYLAGGKGTDALSGGPGQNTVKQ